MADRYDVYLSYSRNDLATARILFGQLKNQGLSVFWDKESIREGEPWLPQLQEAVDTCGSFVILVGRDGVQRWVDKEYQAAFIRHCSPRDDKHRLSIFPILIDEVDDSTVPPFLRQFQETRWNGADLVPQRLLFQIRERVNAQDDANDFEGCPFVGLDAYRPEQAHLFFGRRQEKFDALACFDTLPGNPAVRWLEINGNSGSGKSSLMNAGLYPLVEHGWLKSSTGFASWKWIGPMMPGERPVIMLAEYLARTFGVEMNEVRKCLEGDDRALVDWLRGRKSHDKAFLLAIDQFEELFTFADPVERSRFDRLLATALEDADCPLFVISTVRSDFLDRFDELLPALVSVRNRSGKLWTLPVIGASALREIIAGPDRPGSPASTPAKSWRLYWLKRKTSQVPFHWSKTRLNGYGKNVLPTVACLGNCSPIKADLPESLARMPII